MGATGEKFHFRMRIFRDRYVKSGGACETTLSADARPRPRCAMSKKALGVVIKLVSMANTGYFYTTMKNARLPKKLMLRKYDPVVRQHVLFKVRPPPPPPPPRPALAQLRAHLPCARLAAAHALLQEEKISKRKR